GWAMSRRGCASGLRAFSDHSAASASWPLARLISSSRSRSRRAAPLSRALSSRNTSCICSALGSPASHSRTRAALSPEVGAEKAPPVSASRAWVSWVFKLLTIFVRTKESPRWGGTGRILAAKRAKACHGSREWVSKMESPARSLKLPAGLDGPTRCRYRLGSQHERVSALRRKQRLLP